MNQTATHQATYTSQGETKTLYFRNEAELTEALDSWFSIDAERYDGEYRYFDSLHVTWGEVTELVFVCRCNLHECHQATKKNGGFRPGHDAKLVSWLASNVKAGEMVISKAHTMLADRPALQAKLLKQVG